MQLYWLIIGILAVWRLSHLLVSEAGPWHALDRMRRHIAGTIFGDLFNCFYCISIWVAAPFAFLLCGTGNDATWKGRLLLWPALSAGAIIIERTLHRETFAPEPIYYEDSQDHQDHQDQENQETPHVLRPNLDHQSIHRPN